MALSVIVIVPVDGPSPPKVSSVNTGTVTGVSSVVVASSALAVGTSFTGLIVITTKAVSQSPLLWQI